MKRGMWIAGALVLGLTTTDGTVRAGGAQGVPNVSVMTQNLYVGTDVDGVIAALATPDPADDVPTLMAAIAMLERTDFSARARSLAREIGRTRPDVVGLQEVSTIDVDIPPLGILVHLEFLPILLDALLAEGLDYEVAADIENFTATPAEGISLSDHDVLLVVPDRVEVVSSSVHHFDANLGEVAPGVELIRGWVRVDARVDGTDCTIVSLHTEGTGPEELLQYLHAAQVSEVVDALGTTSPVVVMGDFNAQPGSLAYQVMQGSGFTDAWRALRPESPGYTWGRLPDLSDWRPDLTQRIDYVWTRGIGRCLSNGGLQGHVSMYGDVPADRLLNADGESIWPSDHAGLIASVLLAPPGPR